MDELTVDDLSPRERIVFIASCQVAERDGAKVPVLFDPGYVRECERLTELGWLERVEVVHREDDCELAGYRLTRRASTAHKVASITEQAARSSN
jgi:hypothetical protein